MLGLERQPSWDLSDETLKVCLLSRAWTALTYNPLAIRNTFVGEIVMLEDTLSSPNPSPLPPPISFPIPSFLLPLHTVGMQNMKISLVAKLS